MTRHKTAGSDTARTEYSILAGKIALAGAIFLLAVGGISRPIQAQNGAKGGAATAATGGAAKDPAKEAQSLVDAVDDIARLRALAPLKLTASQADSIAAIITTSQNGYLVRLTALAAPLIAIGDEVRAAKRKALTGSLPTQEFDDKIAKTQADFLKKRAALEQQVLVDLSAKVKPLLTPEQVAAAAKQAKSDYIKTGREAKGSDDAWFNQYVLDQLIGNQRVVPLLKEMRTALAASGTVGDASGAGSAIAGSGDK